MPKMPWCPGCQRCPGEPWTQDPRIHGLQKCTKAGADVKRLLNRTARGMSNGRSGSKGLMSNGLGSKSALMSNGYSGSNTGLSLI